MVGQGIKALLLQPERRGFNLFARQTIDDAGMLGMFLANKVEQLIHGFELLADPIIDIGSVETATAAGNPAFRSQ